MLEIPTMPELKPEVEAERSVPTLGRHLVQEVVAERKLIHFLRHLRLPKTLIVHQEKHELQQT